MFNSTIDSLYRSIQRRYRRKRFRAFVELIGPTFGDTIIDVGGTSDFWHPHAAAETLQGVTLVVSNISSQKVVNARDSFCRLVTDGCNLPFATGTMDICFSNSVIEHVGTRERQREFARECSRVGKRLWVQTPAKAFPVEPHYLGLFVHWLNPRLQLRVIPWATLWGWRVRPSREQVENKIAHTRVLSRREFSSMFPGCRVETERFLGIFPKSYIAVRSENPHGQ